MRLHHVVPLLFALSACSASSENNAENAEFGDQEFVESLPLPGVFVMVVQKTSGRSFNLLDPRTNTRSNLEYPLLPVFVERMPIDVSRNGSMLTHVTPGNAVSVSRFVNDGGRPGLEAVTAFENLSSEPKYAMFNVYGDRVATAAHWLNIETNEVFACDMPSPTDRVIPLPDGYHYLCGEKLYWDGFLIADDIDPQFWGLVDAPVEFRPPTADGQLLGPSIKLRPFTFETSGPHAALGELAFSAWDSTSWIGDSVTHGDYVVKGAGIAENGFPVDTCNDVESVDVAQDSRRVDALKTFNDGVVSEETSIWPIETALAEYYAREQSRHVKPLAVHPQTGEVIYNVATRVVVRGVECTNRVVESFVVAVSASGETRAFDSARFDFPYQPLEASRTPWLQPGPLREYGVLARDDGDFLLPTSDSKTLFESGRSEAAFVGYVNGEPTRVLGSMIDSEGRYVFQRPADRRGIAQLRLRPSLRSGRVHRRCRRGARHVRRSRRGAAGRRHRGATRARPFPNLVATGCNAHDMGRRLQQRRLDRDRRHHDSVH